jgi:hypothetical protein
VNVQLAKSVAVQNLDDAHFYDPGSVYNGASHLLPPTPIVTVANLIKHVLKWEIGIFSLDVQLHYR